MEKKIDFLALYQRLFQTLSHGKMQELMDVSYEVTGVPILAVDSPKAMCARLSI